MSEGDNTQISPTYLLLAIAHHLPEGRKCFNDDSERLHTFFYSQMEKHPRVLGHFKFEWDGSYPRCKKISNAISNMVISGIMMRPSSTLRDCYFDSLCEEMYHKSVAEKFPNEILSEIEEIAYEFDLNLAVNEKFIRKYTHHYNF